MTKRSALAATLVVLAVVAMAAGAAGPADAPSNGPRIRFDETTHDFGALRSDRPVEFAWTFHNDGDAPLTILGTRPSCGCTATALDDEPVPPGGTGTLRVTFDPAGMHGRVRKSLAVMSDDPVHSRLLLTLRAEVTPVASRERAEGGHPPISGRSMLTGECATCHATPAAGKSGKALWDAVCAMCHGPNGDGPLAPSVRETSYLSSRSDEELTQAIAYGSANPKMPGFSELMGGPLGSEQIESLVRWMRSWDARDGSTGR